MTALRVAVALAWALAQLLGLLVGGFALLGAQYGQPGTAALGVVLLLAPAIIGGGGLWLAARSGDPAGARAILAVALLLLVGGIAAVLLSVVGARGG